MAAQDGDTEGRSREASEAFKMVSTMWVVIRKKVRRAVWLGSMVWWEEVGRRSTTQGHRGPGALPVRDLCIDTLALQG